MEKAKSCAAQITSSLKNLQLDSLPKTAPSRPSSQFYTLPIKKPRTRRLVSLCLGVIGQHFEDIIVDLTDIALLLPPDIKLVMLAIAKRRRILNDDVLIALADASWNFLDISGSDVTDFGLSEATKMCILLKAVDVSCCEHITVAGVSELLNHCHSLEILRCGGCPRNEFTARRCVSLLKPKLNDMAEESWEELASKDMGNGAQSLRWLVWPKIDDDSKMSITTECPRIVVNPQPSPLGIRGVQVPAEAVASVPLDHSVVEDIDPRTWAISVPIRRPLGPPPSDDASNLPIAEKFRLAFLERDARFARKRAKNERQHNRRALRELLMRSDDVKSMVLASQVRFLQKKGW